MKKKNQRRQWWYRGEQISEEKAWEIYINEHTLYDDLFKHFTTQKNN